MSRDREDGRGSRIEKLMGEQRVSQRELAQTLGASQRTIQKWLAGGPMRPANVRRCAEALGVTPDYLDYGVEAESPPPHEIVARLLAIEAAIEQIARQIDRIGSKLGVLEREERELIQRLDSLPLAVLDSAPDTLRSPASPLNRRGTSSHAR